MNPDLTYTFIGEQSAQFTAHTDKGREFLADLLPTGRCWAPRLRTDHHTGYVQIAEGRGLTVTSQH